MQVDAIALDLRPRSMMEASDLGVRLAQAQSRPVWRTVGPVYLGIVLLALSTVEIAPWLPAFIVFWSKPWLERSLLFVMARAVFGQDTRFADLWREQRQVWWRQLPSTLTWRRLSPWRSFTQPVRQLEGQRGGALRRRRRQLLRGRRGAALAMHAAFAHIELLFVLGLIALAAWFEPNGRPATVLQLLDGEATAVSLITAVGYAVVVWLVEPFYVAAGFAMYLNRRVELEAWDIEQEFRRAFA